MDVKLRKRVGNKLTICAYCGQPVYKWGYELKESPRHFCNIKCKGKWMSLHLIAEKSCNWKGGTYSSIARILSNARYIRVKKMVLVMDKNTCQLCGSNERLEVHHIIEKGKNPALIYDITNLITLCKKCHCDIFGHEEDYVGIFDGIVANRMNCGKPRTGNPQPSSQSEKVQRLLEHSDMLNNQLERPARKG